MRFAAALDFPFAQRLAAATGARAMQAPLPPAAGRAEAPATPRPPEPAAQPAWLPEDLDQRVRLVGEW